MIWPPSILRLRIIEERGKKIRLWIPLFLLWPLILAIMIVLSPIILLVAIVTWRKGYGKMILLGGPRLFMVICNMRGLRVKVNSSDEQVYVAFI